MIINAVIGASLSEPHTSRVVTVSVVYIYVAIRHSVITPLMQYSRQVNLKYTRVKLKQNGSSTIVKIYTVTTSTCSSERVNLPYKDCKMTIM